MQVGDPKSLFQKKFEAPILRINGNNLTRTYHCKEKLRLL